MNKIDKTLAGFSKKKGKTQINKIRNVGGDITTCVSEIKRTITDYCEQFYGEKLNNLEKSD